MVSQAQTDRTDPATPASKHQARERGGVRRLLTSVRRLVDLQYRIWLTQAKLALMKMVIYTILFVGAALLGVLAVIFLCIGVFHVLTDVCGIPPWAAFLIFGGGLALIAIIMMVIGTRMLTRSDSKGEPEEKP